MGYQSELALENEVLNQLDNLGYERVQLRTQDELINNFRNIINERHMKELNNKPLSDREFNRLITDINGKTVFDSSVLLRDKYVLTRDDESVSYIELLDQEKWCQNKFQVTNQVSVKDTYRSRYDVTILINGLPLVQVELKRSGVAISEAFNQVERYRKQNFTGLFKFIQLFVVSNKMETRYYANSDKTILKSSMFYWSDEKNERINYLKDFIDDFLEPCHLAKMISRYMVVNETDKLLMALRPYQVYAVEKIIERALETNNNGYVWHTTGSGKTLTSFKASQILSQQKDIKKVIFLVDRKDLDNQTLSEFNKFQDDSVDLTDNTKKLLDQLGDATIPLIVTTIQKMSNAIKSGNPVMDQYKHDKVIFIIDECHRSQFGGMHRQIKQHFKNAQYFGFTGTPRFEENKSSDGRATADIFDKCLHHYLIKDAIRDGNVLGFSVDYAQTHDISSSNMNTQGVWKSEKRLELIVDHIIEHYNKKTRNGEYTSMLTVQSIPVAIQYYNLFKKAKAEGKHNLNVTTIFSLKPNEDANEDEDFVHSRVVLDSIMADYNETFGTNHSTDYFDGYFSDVSKKMKKVDPNKKIDILIVVNMFLTGFDSKKLNTLYVDKNLKHHDLIQAYSRTNRVEKERKPYGNIVCYRDLKEATDEAIEIFSQTDNTDTVLSASYDEYLAEFKRALEQLLKIAKTPYDVDQLEREDEQKEFVLAFRSLANILLKLKTFEEFEFTEDALGISEQTYEDYKGKYLNLYDKVRNREKTDGEEETVLDDIDFRIEMLRNDLINVQYIMELIGQINLRDKEARERDLKEIHAYLDKADDDQLRRKSGMLRTFIDEVVPTLENGTNIIEEYYKYEANAKLREINEFANDKSYPPELLESIIDEYEFSGNINKNTIDKGLKGKGKLIERKKIADKIKSFILETAKKYGNEE
nr:type I restriction endonuclease subunit R [Mammaliicoccus sp. Marseille-Q6498]